MKCAAREEKTSTIYPTELSNQSTVYVANSREIKFANMKVKCIR